ncbi:MAG: hypothetical protein ACYTAF_04900, partial [Planctomycetota bacterium]
MYNSGRLARQRGVSIIIVVILIPLTIGMVTTTLFFWFDADEKQKKQLALKDAIETEQVRQEQIAATVGPMVQ